MQTQPWIAEKKFDLIFFILPSFISVAMAFFIALYFPQTNKVSLGSWIGLILVIDVGHVYSSLYKTYFHPVAAKKMHTLLFLIPILSFIVSVGLYFLSDIYFWRAIAYLAVFHFIRQQYGFFKIYSREEKNKKNFEWLEKNIIYIVTLYPIIYWHTHLPRKFNWFIENDFFSNVPLLINHIAFGVYIVGIVMYVLKEILIYQHNSDFNLPKNLFFLGTTASWYVGIILFNNDLIFTLTNVVSHGVPYFAMIWWSGATELASDARLQKTRMRFIFLKRYFFIFFGILFLLSFIEEGLWDGFVWREHLNFFTPFSKLPEHLSDTTFIFLIPLLALPQLTHYILDGFIWKKKDLEFLK
jgi:hypothetical protein